MITDTEKEQIRRYLGYPNQEGHLEAIADATAALPDAMEVTVKGYLRQLERLQQLMTNTVPFAAQTFSSGAGGTQQYPPGQRMATLHIEANQYISELASTLRLTIHRRIYGQNWNGGRNIRG